jgi:hypothetical protein
LLDIVQVNRLTLCILQISRPVADTESRRGSSMKLLHLGSYAEKHRAALCALEREAIDL